MEEAPPVIEEKPKNPDDDEDEDSDEEDKKKAQEVVEVPVIEEKPGEEEEIPEYLPFKEEDFQLRSPKEKYLELKRLEDMLLDLKIDNLKVYVVCAGILFGAGEIAFKEQIKVYEYRTLSNFRLPGSRIQLNFLSSDQEKILSQQFTSTILPSSSLRLLNPIQRTHIISLSIIPRIEDRAILSKASPIRSELALSTPSRRLMIKSSRKSSRICSQSMWRWFLLPYS